MSKLLLPLLLIVVIALPLRLAAQVAPGSPSPAALPASKATPVAPGAPPNAAPPSDPFVRGPAAKVVPPPAKEAEPPPANLLTTVETWSLSRADFAVMLEGPADERAPYDRLEALAKAGKAKLLGLQAISTKSGQRATVESIDELRFPTEFKPAARSGEHSFPTSFETRNTGETLELEPLAGPDGRTIDVNIVPQTGRFAGFQDWLPEEGGAAISQPHFQTERVTTGMTVQSGRPVILSTATPARTAPGDESVRVRVLRVAVESVPPGQSSPVEVALDLRIDLLIFSLERAAARNILAETTDSVQSYAAVRDLVARGAAQLETVSSFLNKAGQRAVNEEIFEFRYPTNGVPPGYDSQTIPKENRQPASFGSFETRNTGVTVEIEPSLGPDGRFVDINVVPQVVQYGGLIRANGAAANYPPQPLFTTRKLQTSVSSGAGLPVLLGTMSQPRETGVNDRKDDGRTGLAYIRVTPIRP